MKRSLGLLVILVCIVLSGIAIKPEMAYQLNGNVDKQIELQGEKVNLFTELCSGNINTIKRWLEEGGGPQCRCSI